MTTTVIETCRVAPPPGVVVEQSLPLTYFDIMWLHFHPITHLHFYEFPCSKPHFLESVVPKLKQSLSKTLKHFFPLSCNLIYPLSPEKLPEFRYLSGDSVSFTVAESTDDFDDLVANRAKSPDSLYCFVPNLPQIVEEPDRKLFQVFAAQVTLFPGRGVGIGMTKHHSVGDATSFLAFITRWASINKYREDEEVEYLLSVCDRSVVKYPTEMDSINWEWVRRNPLESRHPSLPTNRIRATFVFNESKIKKLKGLIESKVPSLFPLSSFVAIAAYTWVGLAKSLRAVNSDGGDDDEEPTFFVTSVDLRPRLDPPVPRNYYGNCISFAVSRIRRRELVGEEGVFLAAEAIAAAIEKMASHNTIAEWSPEIHAAVRKSCLSVAGSSRFDLYGADFGWGKARKQEILSIDGDKYAMSMCRARDFEGGVEVCLSLPKEEMEHFQAYFSILPLFDSKL